MAGVILLARRFHINPDNVATPIAASLGDLTTISLLAAISMFIFRALGMLFSVDFRTLTFLTFECGTVW